MSAMGQTAGLPRAPEAPDELKAALHRVRPGLVRAAAFSVAINGMAISATLYMLEVYDRVVGSRSSRTLLMLTLIVLAAYALQALLEWVRAELMTAAGRDFEAGLADRVFEAILQADLLQRIRHPHQASHDLRTLHGFLAAPVLTALMDAPVAALLLIVLWAIHPVLGACALFGCGVQLLLAWQGERRTQPLLASANQSAMQARAHAAGSRRNAPAVMAMGMLPALRQRWQAVHDAGLAQQAEASAGAATLVSAGRLVQGVQGSALLGLGCWRLFEGDLAGGGGMMIVASLLGSKVLQPLMQLVGGWRQLAQAREAWQRLAAFLHQIPVSRPGMPLPAVQGGLSVEHVTAGAPGGAAPILHQIHFRLSPGEALGVIGASAAGKSTLARVLLGVWPTLAGSVRLDGADVRGWARAAFGPQVGYLPQQVALFDGTLAENVARFGPVDAEAVRAALHQAGLGDWLATLPQGQATRLGDDGTFLSAGLRQRVGLARALYGTPRLVVLDEPNAHLDPAGEQALLEALAMLRAAGTTVVLITHRRGVLAAVDRLLVLAEGSVRQFGPRDEVLAALAGPPGATAPYRTNAA